MLFPYLKQSARGFVGKPRISFELALVVLLACGCAGIPKEPLNAYVSSVGEAKEAGQTLLTDWRSARAEFERREGVKKTNSPVLLEFPAERRSTLPGAQVLSAEDTRALAWEAIAEYTAVLARLNAGESVAEVKKTTGRLF